MEWLNYHHLLYFWTVAREGTIARASEELRLAQPTISGQIRVLEDQLGEKLFQRSGRNLVLTDMGRLVYRYADDIFGLGRELMDTLKDRPTGRPMRFQVGVADEVTKIIAYRLLEPAMRLPQPVHIVCRDGAPERLLTDLATHSLDLVIADTPISPAIKVKAFSHPLGETPVTVFATAKLAASRRKNCPRSLDGAPFLVPTIGKTLRRTLDHYFEQQGLRPRIVAELDDSALLTTFGQAGAGLFVAPTVLEKEVTRQFGVTIVGRLDSVRERYFAISVERRLKHPAVVAISEAANEMLTAKRPRSPRATPAESRSPRRIRAATAIRRDRRPIPSSSRRPMRRRGRRRPRRVRITFRPRLPHMFRPSKRAAGNDCFPPPICRRPMG